MGTILLNNNKIAIYDNLYTVLQQCELLGVVIPRFCYHEKLSIAGNCRICLVEVNNSFKLIIACATIVTNNMIVNTINDVVKNARENIVEFLLINHPLDCPICDQGGECDLQDQTLLYGRDRSRFREKKRAVLDKNFSPFIKTIMNRCIHCTRCIRYFNEVIGDYILGTVGRGNLVEISNYIHSKDSTELSGNVIDVCPVGALTSKPFSFSARPWELINIETIDLLDAFCSYIRVNLKDDIIVRILPSVVNSRNEYWITNKIRFSYDSIRIQRIYNPKIKNLYTTKLVDVSWKKMFKYVKYNINKFSKTINFENHFYAYSGKFIDLESLISFKLLFRRLDVANINIDITNENDFYSYYLLKTCSIVTIEEPQLFILYGINTKIENSIVNLKLRRISLESQKEIYIFYIGSTININYIIKHIGLTMSCILELYYGSIYISYYVLNSFKTTFINGKDAANDDFNNALVAQMLSLNLYKTIEYQYNNLFSGLVSILDLNITSKIYSKLYDRCYHLPKFIYFCGYENYDHLNVLYKNLFLIYQGHHYDLIAKKSTVLIPSPTFIEKNGLFMDCDGLLHYTNKIWGYEDKFKDDLYILNGLSEYLRYEANSLNYNNTKLNVSLNKLFNYKLTLFRYYNYNNTELSYTHLNFLLYFRILRYQFIEDALFINLSRNFFSMDVFNKTSSVITKYMRIIKSFSNF